MTLAIIRVLSAKLVVKKVVERLRWSLLDAYMYNLSDGEMA